MKWKKDKRRGRFTLLMTTKEKIEQAHLTNLARSKFKKEDHADICAHFGCGKKLTLVETLAGKVCEKHSGVVKMDIMKILKFK